MSSWRKSQRSGLEGHFGPLELAILDVMWSGGAMDVAECARRLGSGQAYTTVKTVMERLVVKSLLGREKQGRHYVYWPEQTRREVEQNVAAEQVRRVMDGFGDLAVANFVQTVSGDAEQLAQVRALLAGIAEPQEDVEARGANRAEPEADS
ncbi:BlaI/MecI/CopY family transcriptional regulator [Streptomyces sp. NPDC050617]|uniref:BlaI/MecI/CopY family transcriptional regulator n=1 Tax=Streptomyces sp. NPDC050617 TaxID=3154628 RepID=UPI0034496D49